jgi:hypothetical protein
VPDTKLMVRPRRVKPVEERFFFLAVKSAVLESSSSSVRNDMRLASVLSSVGDGGVLERVVVDDLFIEKRRLLRLGGGPPLAMGTDVRLKGS